MPLVAGPPGLIARLLRANPCCVRKRRRELDVNLSSPANIGIVSYLEAMARSPRSVSAAQACASASPESVTNPYYDLGTHPELVERLWDRLTVKLPADCRWIVYGAPALVRPSSGIVFAFAGGTQTYALRLPTREREAALRAGPDGLTNTRLIRRSRSRPRPWISTTSVRSGCSEAGSKVRRIGASLLTGSRRRPTSGEPAMHHRIAELRREGFQAAVGPADAVYLGS